MLLKCESLVNDESLWKVYRFDLLARWQTTATFRDTSQVISTEKGSSIR